MAREPWGPPIEKNIMDNDQLAWFFKGFKNSITHTGAERDHIIANCCKQLPWQPIKTWIFNQSLLAAHQNTNAHCSGKGLNSMVFVNTMFFLLFQLNIPPFLAMQFCWMHLPLIWARDLLQWLHHILAQQGLTSMAFSNTSTGLALYINNTAYIIGMLTSWIRLLLTQDRDSLWWQQPMQQLALLCLSTMMSGMQISSVHLHGWVWNLLQWWRVIKSWTLLLRVMMYHIQWENNFIIYNNPSQARINSLYNMDSCEGSFNSVFELSTLNEM